MSRPHFLSRALRVVAILTLVPAFAIVVRNARLAHRFLHPSRDRVTAEESARAHRDIAGLEDVTLHTADGLTLRGWFSPGSRRSAVIFVHGLESNRMQREWDARVVARHGYGVLLFDSRASGDSDGDVATWGDREQLDVRAAVDYVLTRRDVDPSRVAIVGHSVGASTVAMASARDPRLRAVILYATWTSLAGEIRTNVSHYGPLSWGPVLLVMRAEGVNLDNVTPLAHIADISPRPLLMITGSNDANTPVPVMRSLFDRAGQPKELWVVDGAGHGDYVAVAPEEFESKVVGFLDRVFG